MNAEKTAAFMAQSDGEVLKGVNATELAKLKNDAKKNAAEVKRLRALVACLVEDMKWFCERVEKGEVKSKTTYARFKEAIALAEQYTKGRE